MRRLKSILVAFHTVLPGITVSSERQHGGLTGLEPLLVGKILRGVSLPATGSTSVILQSGVEHHEIPGLNLGPIVCED